MVSNNRFSLSIQIVCVMLLLELSERPLDVVIARSLLIAVVLLWGIAALWLTFTGRTLNSNLNYPQP